MNEVKVGEPGYGIDPKDIKAKKTPPKPLFKGPDWSRFLHPSKIPLKPKEGKPLEFTEPDKKPITKKGK